MSIRPPLATVRIVDADDSRASTPEELSSNAVAGRSKRRTSMMKSTRSFSMFHKQESSVNLTRRKSRAGGALTRKASTMSSHSEGDDTNAGSSRPKKSASRMKFPTYEELNLLPEEIQQTLKDLVIDFFRTMLYPRALLVVRRKQKKAALNVVGQQVPTVPVNFLQQIPFFSRWTNLESLITALELQLFDKDEILCQEGELAQSGIFFLVQGSISVRKQKPLPDNYPLPHPKGCGDHLTQQVRVLEPLSCYGEKIFLTEEPRMETLKTTSRCAVWVLKRRQFFQLFQSLPEDRRRQVQEHAYERRREIMPKVFPVDAHLLAEAPLFSDTPLENLQLLAAKVEPRVYAKGSNICTIGDSGNEMYYISRGKIQMSMIAVEGEEPLISTVEPGTIVGEMGVFSTKKRNITLYCETACDAYSMDHDMISSALGSSQALMSKILRRAHALQTEYQEHSRKHHFDWISEIPLINSVKDPKLYQAILGSCEGKVYPLHSSIISVAECCDRLVMFTRGKARISSMNVDLKVGEALGFTCLIPHRWAYHVVAGETVESIEIPYAKLKKILVSFGVYEEIKQLSLGLLYPRVHPESFQKAIATARHYCNPPCFPTSLDYDPKPFAARVTSTVSNKQVLSPLNKPKKRIESLFSSGPHPVQGKAGASHNTSQYAQEAASFLETLDKEMAQEDLARNNDGSGSPDHLSPADRRALERNRQKEADERKQRADTRKRLTMGKQEHMARQRSNAEMDRLSRKIRELERQQAASVPPGAKLNSTSTSISPARRRKSTSLPPIHHSPKKTSGDEGNNTRGLEVSPKGKLSRTIAIQTDRSYLHSKALKLERQKALESAEGGGGKDNLAASSTGGGGVKTTSSPTPSGVMNDDEQEHH